MLVKFLSFIASILGTARYKAIVLSCLVLTISLTSIAGMALWHGSGQQSAASKLEQPEPEPDTKQGSPQVRGSNKQAIQNNSPDAPASSTGQSGNTATPPPADSKPSNNGSTSSTPTPVTLSKSELTLDDAGELSELLTATVVQGSAIEWTITASDNPAGVTFVSPDEQTGTTFKFRIKTEQGTVKPGTYQVIIQAKDTTQNTAVTSATITLTIQ
jgi:hypothetical protein